MNVGVIIGNNGVSQVKSYLERRGYMCNMSPEGQPSDLVITVTNDQGKSPSSYFAIQVKTTNQDKASIKTVSKTTSGSVTRDDDGTEHNNKYERNYIPGDFDIMCVYVEKLGKPLFIPHQLSKKEIVIKIRPPKNGCSDSYYYYTDFLSIKKCIKYLEEEKTKNGSESVLYRKRFDGTSDKEDNFLINQHLRKLDLLTGIWQFVRRKSSEYGFPIKEIDPTDEFSQSLFPFDGDFEDEEILENIKISTTRIYGDGKKQNLSKENEFFT